MYVSVHQFAFYIDTLCAYISTYSHDQRSHRKLYSGLLEEYGLTLILKGSSQYKSHTGHHPQHSLFSLQVYSTKLQHWAIVFDSDLQSRNQFAIVSYPVPEYIVCLNSTDGYSYRLALERIPFWRYVNGAPFYNPGCNCTFTTGDCYRNSRFSGQYIQHVATSLALTHNSDSRISPSLLQSNGYGQCWVYPAL